MSRGLWLAFAAACAEPASTAPSAPADPAPASDPIGVTRGSRTLAVRCDSSCAAIEAELERLAGACRRDPLSTPHAILTEASAVALGCCEEAASAHREACGDETTARCTSGWRARCGAAAIGAAR
jgi:hypothetical protein